MSNLLTLFANNLLPIFLTAGAGYLAGRWLNIDARSISRLVFYVFSPCLIFDLLASSQLSNGDMLQMIAFTISCILVIGLLTYGAGRVLKLPRKTMAAVLLATMTLNAGNYGLSLNLFAFGEEGLAYASLFFVTSAIVTYTVGVAIASMGSASLGDSLKGLLKIPTVYAVILAVLFVAMNWQLPLPLQRSVSLLSDASIPGMLIILGLQLQKNDHAKDLRALALANGMRLIGGPLIAFGLVLVFGLQGTARQVGITQAAMPTAVLSIVLATEYDTEPTFVTTTVFLSTLLSPIVLTPLLAYLGA